MAAAYSSAAPFARRLATTSLRSENAWHRQGMEVLRL